MKEAREQEDVVTSAVTIEDLKTLLPYCIPEKWMTWMSLFGREDWKIPEEAQEVLIKIFDTSLPWERFPAKGARRIWLRTSRSEEEAEALAS